MRRHPLYEQDRLLNSTLGFTDEDLAANQQGYLSDKQRLRLKHERRKWKFFIGVTLLAYPVGLMLIIFPETYRPASAGIGVRIAASVTIFICWLFVRDLDDDLNEGKVQVVRGAIKLGERIFRRQGQSYYYLSIENMTWNVRKTPSLAFADGDPYAIYYAPHSKTLLSAEWLRES